MTKNRTKLGALAAGALFSLVAHNAGAHYDGIQGADVHVGATTGYVYNELNGFGSRSTAHLWGFCGHGSLELNSGHLRGLYGEVGGRYAWAFSEKRRGVGGRSSRNTWDAALRGVIGYNVARLLSLGDSNFYMRPLAGYSWDHQRIGNKGAAPAQGRRFTWHGPWVGLGAGTSFGNVHSVGVRGAVHFLTTSRITGVRGSSRGYGFEARGKYRYAINNRWGAELSAAYKHRRSGRGGVTFNTFCIMGGVSAEL